MNRITSTTVLGNRVAFGLFLTISLLLFVPLLAFAQGTGPPAPPEPIIFPPPGSVVIQPIYPAVPPPSCLDPVVGNGALAVFPPQPTYGDNVIGVVNALLDNNKTATLLIPLTEDMRGSTVVVRIASAHDLPAPLPDWVDQSVPISDIDICLVRPDGTHTLLKEHHPPLELGLKVLEGEDPTNMVLIRYDAPSGQYEALETSYIADTQALKSILPKTSRFVEVTVKPGATIPPSGLPTTGGGTHRGFSIPWLLIPVTLFLVGISVLILFKKRVTAI